MQGLRKIWRYNAQKIGRLGFLNISNEIYCILDIISQPDNLIWTKLELQEINGYLENILLKQNNKDIVKTITLPLKPSYKFGINTEQYLPH